MSGKPIFFRWLWIVLTVRPGSSSANFHDGTCRLFSRISSSPISHALRRFFRSRALEMAFSDRPGSSFISWLEVIVLLLRRTSYSASVQTLANLPTPELLLTGRALDDLAGSVSLFVEVEVAVRAVEVGSDVAKDVFEIVTVGTHAKALLLSMTKRCSARRIWPRLVFLNGAGWRFQVWFSSRKRNAAPMARWAGSPLSQGCLHLRYLRRIDPIVMRRPFDRP
jgi:hypothetical protein